MNNIELIVQIKNIEYLIRRNNGKSNVPTKTALDFEVSSYSKRNEHLLNKIKKEKNTLLTFGKMSDFVTDFIQNEDYILIKGDLREVSNNENIFLPLSIQKIDDKKIKIRV